MVPADDIDDPFKPLRRGLLELAVLSVIAANRMYAAELIERLATTPFATSEGTLYPLLGKLRREGFLEYDWEESESGPPRKYYRLAAAGAARLESLTAYWGELVATITELGAPA